MKSLARSTIVPAKVASAELLVQPVRAKTVCKLS